MLDINKLHDVIEGRATGKKCGRTTAMLAEALGLADFGEETVFILCGTTENAERCLRQMVMLALGMKFVDIQEMPANILKVNNTMYCFRATLEPANHPDAPKFYDYACGGPVVMNHKSPQQFWLDMLNNRN